MFYNRKSVSKSSNSKQPKNPEDVALANACLQMDEKEWAIFLRRYKPMCLAIARKKRISDEEFDNLFTDFIIKLLGGLNGKPGALRKYDGRVLLKTFLSVVFGNMAIDHLREKRAKSTPVTTEYFAGQQLPGCVHTSVAAETEEINTIVRKAVATLSKAEQRIIDLHYYDGFSLRQISDILICNKSTVSRKLKSIYRKLK